MTTDPRHLLGGYATDNLSPEERRALFTAALEDPDLFAALADEEALRDLLSDPKASLRVRAALAPRVRPLWRRPLVLGSAAGLLFVASTTALLWRDHPTPTATTLPKSLPAPEPAPAAAPAPPRPPAPPPARSRTAVPPPALEEAPAFLHLAPAEAPLGVPAERKGASPKALEGLASRSAERFAGVQALADESSAIRALSPRLTLLPEGRFRLEAPPPGAWHPYLLRRRGSTVELVPGRRDPDSGDLRFEGQLQPGDALDYYLLEAPAPEPAALPAEGPVKGQRQRVYPRSP